MTMYVGDLKPDLTVTCLDGDAPVDLTTATSVTVVGTIDGSFLFSRSATGTDANGVVTMAWQSTDTDTPGRLAVEVIVTWSGGKPQTFRPSESIQLLSRFPTA